MQNFRHSPTQASHFRDYSLNGALCHIIGSVYKSKQEQDLFVAGQGSFHFLSSFLSFFSSSFLPFFLAIRSFIISIEPFLQVSSPASFLTHSSRRFDFASPGKVDRNMEIFLQIEKTLTDVCVSLSSAVAHTTPAWIALEATRVLCCDGRQQAAQDPEDNCIQVPSRDG
jgi:hypothetical protein